MNEFKGTPGPWIKREIEGAFHKQKAYAIDFNEDQEQVVDYVYREEDANLIAAAPRLLAAAQRYLDFRHTSDIGMGCEYSGVHPETDLKNAIADALGK